MKYMGSKRLLKKDILPILQRIIDEHGIKKYIEPFVGGANIIDSIKCEKKIGSDINPYLIELFRHIEDVKGMPDFISHEEYSRVRESYNKRNDDFPDWYKGAVGFLSSYNGRFFDGGYSGCRTTNGKTRNYFLECKNNILKQSVKLTDIEWNIGDYAALYSDVSNALIYCDIPYKNTTHYGAFKFFNYDRFWHWARQMSKNNIVIISEQTAPSDFEPIWTKEITRFVRAVKKIKATESLFRIAGATWKI